MYFLSLGFNLINIPFMIRTIIDGPDVTINPSPKSIALSGKVESVDRLLTFAGIGLLSALSDKYGRKPLMTWSAIGFMLTNLIQANCRGSIASLYLADFIDGCSSCMLPVCQAYVVDCSSKDQCASNLGVFQGLSGTQANCSRVSCIPLFFFFLHIWNVFKSYTMHVAGGAFIFAFPIGGLIGARKGPKVALLIAAAIQAINALVLIFLTPESHDADPQRKIAFKEESNPIGGLVRLFGHGSLLRLAAGAYFLASLARGSLDAQFPNYTNLRFGWTQAQSGPVLVMVGLMLAIAPRILVPRFGLRHSIVSGLLIFAMGLTGAGLAPTPSGFVASIAVIAVGCVCLPTLQALLANLAPPGERGALLGAVGSVTELTGAIASIMYATLLAKFTSKDAPLPIPGFHFLVGAALLLIAWGLALPGLKAHKDSDALAFTAASSSNVGPILD
jgi:MFS transporter, DHA1 family, tetracycline resistance protein